jgi:hypothetical protein
MQFCTRYDPRFSKLSIKEYIEEEYDDSSFDEFVNLIQAFHTKKNTLDKVQHMTLIFHALLRDPILIQQNWKFNCSIKSKIIEMRGEYKKFTEDKKRYRQLYSILGGFHDKSEIISIHASLGEALDRRIPIDRAFHDMEEVMTCLEKIVDEYEKEAFTLKLLKDKQLYMIQ